MVLRGEMVVVKEKKHWCVQSLEIKRNKNKNKNK